VIRYLGSKRSLIPLIILVMRQFEGLDSCIDLFSGSARVGQALKAQGYRVLSNDLNAYADVLARCYVQTDSDRSAEARELIAELNATPDQPGWFTETYCEKSSFFQRPNGERIDGIREAIESLDLDPEMKAVALTSLIEAADDVLNTMGMHKAFIKDWMPMSFRRLDLQVPTLLPCPKAGKCRSFQMDAINLLGQETADIVYMDPPYNNENYLNMYHLWESIVLWDKPEVYGTAQRRVDIKTRKSSFNAKRRAAEAMTAVVEAAKAEVLVVSFNDEGHISRDEMVAILETRGHVTVIDRDYQRYTGALTGIHNQQGEKVGEVSHTRNTEYIFVCSQDPKRIEAIDRLQAKPNILDFFGEDA